MIDEEMKTLLNEVIRKTVWMSGLRRRFISVIWNSFSKSLVTRRPRTMAMAPTLLRVVDGEPVEGAHLDAGAGSMDSRIRSTRSSVVNSGVFDGFCEHPDDDAVEDQAGAFEDVEVAAGHRVEAARVQRDPLTHRCPPPCTAGRRTLRSVIP